MGSTGPLETDYVIRCKRNGRSLCCQWQSHLRRHYWRTDSR